MAARDRVAVFPLVGEDRRREISAFLSILIGERFKPLVHIPAVVFTAMNDVHLLLPILSDIREPEIARDAIEAEAPWVAEPVCPNLRSRVGPAAERIIGGN